MTLTIPPLLVAMARMEGINVAGSIPERNNNPGDIEFGKFAAQFGAIKNGRFAKFPNLLIGFGAMQELLISAAYNHGQITVLDALHIYLGDHKGPDGQWIVNPENDPKVYIANVCAWANCEPDAIVAQVLGVSGSVVRSVA